MYCLEHCPENIQIHLYAAMWDRVRMKQDDEAKRVYEIYLNDDDRWLKGIRASDCTQCGECETACAENLPSREYLPSPNSSAKNSFLTQNLMYYCESPQSLQKIL